MYHAVTHGFSECVSILLGYGVSVECKCVISETEVNEVPLFLACRYK